MKAKCIDNKGYEGSLTVGKEYKVLKVWDHNHTELTVVDDKGHAWEYPVGCFEKVEE